MKRVVFMLALALVIPSLAMAANFTYTTSGLFSGGAGCNTNSCTVGNSTLTFNGLSTVQGPFAPGSDVSMGSFSNVTTGSGGTFTGIGFTLTVTQILPGAGSGPISGTLQGTITGVSSNGTLQFASSSALATTINSPAGVLTTYTLDTTLGAGACFGVPNCISLGGPNQSAALTAAVTQVPEPASIMLFGSGLTGLAGLVRRRIKK
jgi:hypothetical protein